MSFQKRNIGVYVLLSVITFGIFQIYWEYLILKDIKALKNDQSGVAIELVCLTFVPLYPTYWWFTRGKSVKDTLNNLGSPVIGNETAYMILSMFGMGSLALAILQNDLNNFAPGTVTTNQQGVNYAPVQQVTNAAPVPPQYTAAPVPPQYTAAPTQQAVNNPAVAVESSKGKGLAITWLVVGILSILYFIICICIFK